MNEKHAAQPSGRRLSPLRVVIAVLVLAAVGVGAVFGFQAWSSNRAEAVVTPWFGAYVDVTATPQFEFEKVASDVGRDLMLSFIVASPDDACMPTWGAAYTLDEASAALDLERRIARLRQQDGGIVVSFGGLLNDELSTGCEDPLRLVKAYHDVIDRYDVTTIDLDIEGENLDDVIAGARRAAAIAELQTDRRAAGGNLAVWLTLPTATFGLTESGTTAVQQMLDAGVDLAGVNAMTMNFGGSLDDGESIADASIRALQETQRQLGVLYTRAGTELSDATLWKKIGATPMIGQNDNVSEVFSTEDAHTLNQFALETGLGRMSMWSLNRDVTCGPNYVDLERVSDACSGIDQGDATFASILGAGFSGRPSLVAGSTTTAEPRDPADFIDDPATSPYPIWSKNAAYLKGTKIVWHRNVYEAKWWTKGDLPDNPVLASWDTPWTLIGPVLPGETPIPVPTLPPGTLPDWDGTAIYDKGARVLFDGVPFQAKWWTQGDSPEAFSADPDSSPWAPLGVDDISNILSGESPD